MLTRSAKLLYLTSVTVWALFVINLAAQPAYAYVDPGSGLLALQIIGSTVAGGMYLIRKRIRDLFAFFSKKPKEATKPVEHP